MRFFLSYSNFSVILNVWTSVATIRIPVNNEVWLSNDLLLKTWEAISMVTHIFHWLVIHRIAPAFLLVFIWATVSGFTEPCAPLGPGVVRCGDLCSVPWGSTQVLVTGSFLQWSCLPNSVKVRDGFELVSSYIYSPVWKERIMSTISWYFFSL
jgi:hypothetical protein